MYHRTIHRGKYVYSNPLNGINGSILETRSVELRTRGKMKPSRRWWNDVLQVVMTTSAECSISCSSIFFSSLASCHSDKHAHVHNAWTHTQRGWEDRKRCGPPVHGTRAWTGIPSFPSSLNDAECAPAPETASSPTSSSPCGQSSSRGPGERARVRNECRYTCGCARTTRDDRQECTLFTQNRARRKH